MLSILIPTYNYDIFALVAELNRQCVLARVDFEIIAMDDASGGFANENSRINALQHCSYAILPSNIGRSAIRNLLASKAQFEWLLFLDADVMPASADFIATYLSDTAKAPAAVNGGIVYSDKQPEPGQLLRWVYGKSREALHAEKRCKKPYLSFLSLNFMIPKALFESIRFNESLPNLRHEDTVFSYELRQQRIPVRHIDNPVVHLGLDSFARMIQKEHEALQALRNLLENGLISVDYVKMGRYYRLLSRYGLKKFVAGFFKSASPALLKNLSSEHPSLFLYDLYRIGYLCSL